jgi:hypothetical protein
MERMNRRIAPHFITELSQCEIFVFGSNLEGYHGGGAARIAHEKFGAVWGVGVGPTGRSYAIPTMHGGLDAIKPYVDQFVEYAKTHPMNRFLLTRIGCGIAGFQDREMVPLFAKAWDLPNVAFPEVWLPYLMEVRGDSEPELARVEAPEVVTDALLKQLCEKYRYEIGAGLHTYVPYVRVRYVCDKNKFGYTDLSNCFFFEEGGMYVWEKNEKWEEDHNQDIVECVFRDECKGRGYAHRVIAAGVSTGVRDAGGDVMYMGDVIRISQEGKHTELALCALEGGYGFRLGDRTLLLSECRNKKLTRVGTVFFQLDRSEYPVATVAERAQAFNNLKDNNEQHAQKVLMSRFTPNFDQEPWKYEALEALGAQFHWNK